MQYTDGLKSTEVCGMPDVGVQIQVFTQNHLVNANFLQDDLLQETKYKINRELWREFQQKVCWLDTLYTGGDHSKFSYRSVELSLIPGLPSGPAKSQAGCNQAVINIDF